MISEDDLNMNKELATNEEEKTTREELSTTVDIKNEEETTVASSEEPNTSKEEQTNIKEEKHDVSVKSEPEIADNEMDTQPLFEQPIVLEGKRSRKPTLRLELSELMPAKKELSIPQGHGKPLGEIEYINHQISHASTDDLSRMRNICFGRRGNKANIRKNLREFKGFEFQRDTNEYQKHLSNLTKLKKDQLRSISNILGLPSTGRNTDHAKRILNFLIQPTDEGKRIPGKKSAVRNSKKRSTTSKESVDTDQETKKQKIQNGEDEHGSDYVYKPGKKSSNKRSSNDQNPTDVKRKKGTSTKLKSKENEEAIAVINEQKDNDEEPVKTTENDITDSKLTDENEAIMNDKIQGVV